MKPGIILVVDDEFGIREGCRRALEPEGHEVHLVESVSSARATLETNRFDLVLLDVMMPDGRGMDLIADIHASDPDTVAIIITGYATVELAVEAIQRGAYDFIAKPFSADVLLLAVEQGLEHRRLSQEARGYHQAQARAERLQMEKEEMERLDTYKTEFTRLVAHELRSPVSALISFLRTMAKGYVPAEQQAEILERAIDRADELLDLITDLLDLAEARQVVQAAQLEPISLEMCLREVFDLYQAQASEKQIELLMDTPGEHVVRGTRRQFHQIWGNLIANAIKYTPSGGEVRIATTKDVDHVRASVADTGIGISPESHDRIFEEFYRTPEAKSFSRIGTGLGLSLVKRVVERLGGSISFESIQKGTKFTFVLPLAAEPPA